MNERTENIGARRLHTVMTTLLEDVALRAARDRAQKDVNIDAASVRKHLKAIVEDEDLRRYIL